MFTRIFGMLVVAAMVMTIGACSPVGEPWDSTGHFEKERESSEELQDRLRHCARTAYGD